VEVIKKAPLRDPIEYKIMGYHISLRNSEAQLIEIDRNTTSKEFKSSNGVLISEEENGSWLEKKHDKYRCFWSAPLIQERLPCLIMLPVQRKKLETMQVYC